MGERSACGMYSRSSFTKPMSSLFHASGLRVRIDTVCPASAASAAKMGVELPPPTTVMCMLLRPLSCARTMRSGAACQGGKKTAISP